MESISKRIIDNRTFYVKLNWIDNETELFHIKIVSNDNSWSGRFSQEFAARYMKILDETEEEYKENAKRALKETTTDFTYQFKFDPDDTISAAFSWRRVSPKHVVHGSVPVHVDENPETTNDLIGHLIDVNHHLQQTLESYTKKFDVLTTELNKCRTEMDRFINMKTSLEMSLYEKFIQLLNSKKRRIQLIEENIYERANELD